MTWMDAWFYLNVIFDLGYMLVNDAIGKPVVAPGVLYVIHKYVHRKTNKKSPKVGPFWPSYLGSAGKCYFEHVSLT